MLKSEQNFELLLLKVIDVDIVGGRNSFFALGLAMVDKEELRTAVPDDVELPFTLSMRNEVAVDVEDDDVLSSLD